MKYMIHACPQREWYVKDFLVPSLERQGIPKKDIYVWSDRGKYGNLRSCRDSFEMCGTRYEPDDRTWHLQDDVVLSRRFAELSQKYDEPLINGFCHEFWNKRTYTITGPIVASLAWSSFQAVCIQNSVALEFVQWLDEQTETNAGLYEMYISKGKHDDMLFKLFIEEHHPDMDARNLRPNIVEHIDYLIGGTTLGDGKPDRRRTSWYWYEPEVVKTLEMQLRMYRDGKG